MLAVWLVSLGLISLSCIEAKWLSHSALIAKAESVPAGEHNYYREHLDKITASLNEVRGGEKDPDILPDGYTGTRFYELRGWFECQCAGAVTIVHDEKEPFYVGFLLAYTAHELITSFNHLKHVDQREIMGTPPSNQRVTAYFAVQHRPGEANSAWQDCTLHYQTWTVMMFLNFDAIYITEENTVLYAKPDEGAYFSDKCDDAAMKSIGLPEMTTDCYCVTQKLYEEVNGADDLDLEHQGKPPVRLVESTYNAPREPHQTSGRKRSNIRRKPIPRLPPNVDPMTFDPLTYGV